MDALAMSLNKKFQHGGRIGGRKRSALKTAAARINASKGGAARSPQKTIAARANGRLGGRPSKAAAELQVLDAIFGSRSARVSSTPA